MVSPPRDLEALLVRARGIEGKTVAEVARSLGVAAPAGGVRHKGRVGELIEKALGANGGSGQRVLDFPELGVELKTIPVRPDGIAIESTFIASVDLSEDLDFGDSWVAAKLRQILFVPIVGDRGEVSSRRRIGPPVFFRPTPEHWATLRGDYDDIMGLVGIGQIERVTAHLGQALQLRPKARDGRDRVRAWTPEGQFVSTVPRGFYLRPSFTTAILSEPAFRV